MYGVDVVVMGPTPGRSRYRFTGLRRPSRRSKLWWGVIQALVGVLGSARIAKMVMLRGRGEHCVMLPILPWGGKGSAVPARKRWMRVLVLALRNRRSPALPRISRSWTWGATVTVARPPVVVTRCTVQLPRPRVAVSGWMVEMAIYASVLRR
jgi:hypothetical protein